MVGASDTHASFTLLSRESAGRLPLLPSLSFLNIPLRPPPLGFKHDFTSPFLRHPAFAASSCLLRRTITVRQLIFHLLIMTHLPPPLHCHDKECALVDSPFASLFSPTQMVLRFRNIQPREDTQATPEFTSTPTPNPPQTSSNPTFAHSSAYANWKATRAQFDATLPPGDSRRPVNLTTLRLAATAIRHSAVDLFILLWGVHPFRMSILLLLNFIRGALPAIRSYSQALLLDEVRGPGPFYHQGLTFSPKGSSCYRLSLHWRAPHMAFGLGNFADAF